MSARVTKKALLLLATGLLLAGCTDNPNESTESGASGDESNASVIDNSGNSDASYTSEESSSKSSIDYTLGWDPAIDEQIRRNLGGNGLPFFDLTGEITIIHVDKSSDANAHMVMTSTCAYDQHLVYRAKTQFGLAGWTVSYNNAAQPKDMKVNAVKNDLGINFKMFAKPHVSDNSYVPYIEVYFNEKFNEPAKGTNWSAATLSILSEIGITDSHKVPYLYMGAYNEVATKTGARKALIKGGDWINYETNIVALARKAFSTSKNWLETGGRATANNHYVCDTYTYSKTFSDGYTISAKLYGDAADGSFQSIKDDDVVAYLEVTCTPPKK